VPSRDAHAFVFLVTTTTDLLSEYFCCCRGGAFLFTFAVPHTYPHDPPKVKCLTKVYHPNIDLEGNVCLNILREDWKPVLTITSVVYGLNFLFLVSYSKPAVFVNYPTKPLKVPNGYILKKRFYKIFAGSQSGRPIE
jgi:hypothetical protein